MRFLILKGCKLKRSSHFVLLISVILLFVMCFSSFSQHKTSLFKDNLEQHFITISDSTLYIDGNGNLNNTATFGNGTIGNPYIIENYIINASGLGVDGICIKNTNAHFILSNCTVTNADSG